MSEETKNVDVTEPTVDEQPEEQTNPQEVVPEVIDQEPDYKLKFTESQKEALRLRQELQAKEDEYNRIQALAEQDANHGNDTEPNLYPGFEDLSEAEQESLLAYTNSIRQRVTEDIYKNPAISYAEQSYATAKWNEEFEKVAEKYPDLKESKAEFTAKYKKDKIPDNIGQLMEDLAKIHLFEKSSDIGAKRALEQASRIDIERTNPTTEQPKVERTEEDWFKLAQENPAKYAALIRQQENK